MINIMVVDDSLFIWSMIKDCLKESEFNIVAYASTKEIAIEKYYILKPDIVTVDIVLANSDKTSTIEFSGLELIKELTLINKNISIIAISALKNSKIIYEAIKCGATDYLEKPFSKDILLEKLRELTTPHK